MTDSLTVTAFKYCLHEFEGTKLHWIYQSI